MVEELRVFIHYIAMVLCLQQEHRELAREAVRKLLVLLKNGKSAHDQPLLPLPKKALKILVARSHAGNLGLLMWRVDN